MTWNKAGALETAPREAHAQGRPWLASGHLDFGRPPTIPRAGRRGSLRLNGMIGRFMLRVWNGGACQAKAACVTGPPENAWARGL